MGKSARDYYLQDALIPRNLPHGKSSTVRALMDAYELSDRYKLLADSTKRSYRSAFAIWEKTYLPDRKTIYQLKVHKVDYRLVDHFVQLLRHKYQAPRIKLLCAVMSAAWNLGIRHGRVIINPWTDLRLKCKNERDVVWSEEQVELAISKAKEFGYDTLALYLLMMYETGQRPWIDLRNLTWDNIGEHEDDDGARYYIITYRSSKTGIDLSIPISNRCFTAMQEHSGGTGFIFEDTEGSRRTAQAIHYQFKRVKRQTGISNTLQFRDLRRTSVVELIEAGATDQEIRAIHGWKGNRTLPRYARIRLQAARNGQQKRVKLKDAKLTQAESTAIRPQFEGADEHKQEG